TPPRSPLFPYTTLFRSLLPTTTVGSFPKPEYLKKARAQFSRGEIKRDELDKLEERATREIIEFQEKLGLDILVDGEMYRGDMARSEEHTSELQSPCNLV